MATLTMTQESLQQGHFYAPQFEVRIEGVGLPRDVVRDVREVTYHDDVENVDGFEITVNNWDPILRQYKYVGAETQRSLNGSTQESVLQRLFDPCNKKVELRLGYVNKLQAMMTGIFTTLAPSFPSSGGPTLTVSALNFLHRLRREQHTQVWTNKKDSEIAEEFTFTLPGTGETLHVVTDSTAKGNEQPLVYLAQDNKYDLDFLLTRARKNGYVLVLQEAETDSRGNVTRPAQLYFGPSAESGQRDVTVELTWGKTLMEFRPTLTTANQIKSVTVRGWNRDTKSAIEEKASITDSEFRLNRDLQHLLDVCDPGTEQVVNEPVFTPAQARERARAILLNRARDMVTATATVVGLPDLRAGRNVMISGIGSRFSGRYFITQTTHTIGSNGYTTQFTARREDEGQGG